MNHNTRLCIERRLRMPFLDTQTGTINNSIHLDTLYFGLKISCVTMEFL